MARREVEEDSGIEGGWINTFADLMNLLLCFFVLLFSMSSVDTDKYEALITSLSSSINVFDAGSSAMGDGTFVSSGTDQLVSISEYYNEFEKEGSATQEVKDNDDQGKPADTEDKSKAIEQAKAQQQAKTEELYGEIVDKAKEKNVIDIINIKMDENRQYVKILLKGAVLFDSGKADIRPEAKPILNKLSDILRRYSKQKIEIEGHTDNVRTTGTKYADNMDLSYFRAKSVYNYFIYDKKLEGKMFRSSARGSYFPIGDNKTESGRAKNRRIEIIIYPTDM